MTTLVTTQGLSSLLRNVHASVLLRNSVRYARKPRWVPIAKSKMFTNRELPYRPIHEEEEITRLINNYRTYSKSLTSFQERISAGEAARSQSVTKESSEEAEWDRILAETERDNAIVREIREKQLAEEWRQIEADILAEKAALEEADLQSMQQTEEKLQLQLSKLKEIITLDQLDEVIEKALSKEVDYNFAIDKEDHVYKGRNNLKDKEEISHGATSLLPSAKIESPITT